MMDSFWQCDSCQLQTLFHQSPWWRNPEAKSQYTWASTACPSVVANDDRG